MKLYLLSFALALAMTSLAPSQAETVLQKANRDGIFNIAKGDPEMTAAFAKAQQTLDDFLVAFDSQKPGTRSFLVKIPIVDRGKTEFFWINELTRKGNQFSGKINNRPETVQNVQYGQPISFPRSRIRDWSYVDGGKLQGNFTTCVLLGREDPAQAQELKDQMGLTCEDKAGSN